MNKKGILIALGIGTAIGLAVTLPQTIQAIRAIKRGEPTVTHYPHKRLPLITVTTTPKATQA